MAIRKADSRESYRAAILLLGGPYRVQELSDLKPQAVAFARQLLGRRQDLRRSRTGFGCAALDVDDVGGYLLRSLGGLLNVAGNLLRCRALLLDGGGDGRRDFGQ